MRHGPLALTQRGGRWLWRRTLDHAGALTRARRMRRAWRLPAVPEPVVFRASLEPMLSVIVPVFNQWRYTNACLKALAAALEGEIPTEVIVVDDGSTDETAQLLAACDGIRTVRLESNAGFIGAANAGAAAARGTYLHFLNNDTIVANGCHRALLETFARNERTGAVVSQLRYPNGRLCEAGGIIWSDGQGWNYGRGDSPRNWRYRSLRDVDYGSAASLMVEKNAFERAGRFGTTFAPAYYEDADLCFSLRRDRMRVIYQPRSVVYHIEGSTYGSNVRVEANAVQNANRSVFAQKWQVELSSHFGPDPRNVEPAARRLAGAPTILVIDEHVPFTDRDAGSRRIFFLIELLVRRGWHVIFGSLDRNDYGEHADRLRDLGIEVIAGFSQRNAAMLRRMGIPVRAAWLSRPVPAARLLTRLRAIFPDAKMVFDTVDLQYRRMQRQQQVLGGRSGWASSRRRELAIAGSADATVASGETERALLGDAGVRQIFVLPVIEPAAITDGGWQDRRGVVFLGNYAHEPNVDAAVWLCTAIMPLVWRELPGCNVVLAGADPTRRVRALAGGNVCVTGYRSDVVPLLDAARVFAAPLRFGAGTKGKVVFAMAHGIPVVTTPVGAEDLFFETEYGEISATPEAFAARIIRLHEDPNAWQACVRAGAAIAARFTPEAAGRRLDAVLDFLRGDRVPSSAPTR